MDSEEMEKRKMKYIFKDIFDNPDEKKKIP
jgi:hypothetical protein